MKVGSFLDMIQGLPASPAKSTSAGKPNKLAVIDPSFTGTGNPKVTFEGESTLTTRAYAVLGSYAPKASDRVLMVPVGTSYAIVGKIATPIGNEPVKLRVTQPTALATGASGVMKYGTIVLDTHSAYSATTGLWTCPIAGAYLVNGQFKANSSTTVVNIVVLKNSASTFLSGNPVTNPFESNMIVAQMDLVVGDTVGMVALNAFTSQADSPGVGNFMHITRLSD